MDIQKEREAFESMPEIKQWISALKYGEKTGVYIAIDNNKHEGVANWVNGAWWAWKAAKAQAVPEGFVLMPTVPSERMINAVRQCYEGENYLPYSLYSEFVNQAIIERMKPQEPK